jgi:hypothetical protein
MQLEIVFISWKLNRATIVCVANCLAAPVGDSELDFEVLRKAHRLELKHTTTQKAIHEN